MPMSDTRLVWSSSSGSAAAEPSISRIRKILCSGGVALIVLLPAGAAPTAAAGTTATAGTGTPAGGARQPDLRQARLSQTGRSLRFTLATAAPVPLARLDRLPAAGADGPPYLCLALRRSGRRGERRICLGGASGAHRRVGLELVNAAGKATSKSTIAGRVKRPDPHRLVVTLLPGAAGLAPHRYRWRVLENRRGCAPSRCETSMPASGARTFRLRPVRVVGCTGGTAQEEFNGPRERRVVALTFDDGPSAYTEGFLAVLRREHVHGTFFEIGQEVAGREEAMRRILREGSEIGDHTMNHVEYPGYPQIAAAAAHIEAATHFQPCLFRPPGGAVNSAVIAAAGAAGMETILWDVDPADWTAPGSAAVYSRVVGAARPGSIILMHDGGGDRSGTLAALPHIIHTLRGRGYRFATVSQLLGHRLVYRPYG
jgi:peptidoglycan/xylan/chitin deacetylase (PgdA/CDA1 family)